MNETHSVFPLKRLCALLAFLSLLVLVVFSPTLSANFINYDDPQYVTGNGAVRGGLSLGGMLWAFTTTHSYNWHPITWLSHMLDVSIYGMTPLGHHLSSLLLHLANSLLLFALLKKLTGANWRSLCVAALFALHPLHVESVAWISERKDVLSTFFGLLTLWCYHDFARGRRPYAYLSAVILFALGLMAKPMLVTLPFVFLLLDFWPIGRFSPDASGDGRRGWATLGRLLLEKVPFFLLSAASSVVTFTAQRKGGALSNPASLAECAGNALISYLRYLQKTVCPTGLSPFYPFHPGVSPGSLAIAGGVLTAASLAALWQAKKRPYLLTGWFWYLGTLIPVSGLVKIGQHAMADRYTYLPLIGIFVICAWGGAELAVCWRLKKETQALAVLLILTVLSVASWRQAGYWHDSITLFSHALQVTDGNWLAEENLAKAYGDRGNYPEALRHIDALLQLRPDAAAYVSQAWLYAEMGDYQRSHESSGKALALAPDNEKARYLSGMSDLFLKRYPEAVAEYAALRRADSRFADELLGNLERAGISPAAAGR